MQFFHCSSIDDILSHFKTVLSEGLSSSDASSRLSQYGHNVLVSKKKKTVLRVFLEQFKGSMVIILLVAAVVSGVIGILEDEGLTETIIIISILIINAIIGVFEELKAEASLEALNKMSSPRSKVLREGSVIELVSTEIVPGDVVILETGDIVPADIRLFESVNLKVQEAALTGESVPVEKQTNVISQTDIPIGDRNNMVFSTSIVTYGRAKGIVVATGMNTEVGKIANMLQNTAQTLSPMSKRLEQLGKILAYVAMGICGLIFIIGILYGNNWLDTFMMAISLAVAAIPEGLQIVSTIVLAIGVQRLVKLNAIVKTLPSVETLGSTTVICSDKTGTLTQNKMTVCAAWTNNELIDFKNNISADSLRSYEQQLISSALLCTDAHLKVFEDNSHQTAGDPTETAIVDLALKFGINKLTEDKRYPRVGEIPFDSERKRMSTINKISENNFQINVKGGLDEILSATSYILSNQVVRPITSDDLAIIKSENDKMAQSALRVLAVAYKDVKSLNSEITVDNIEQDLIFIGMLGMIDPARPEVIEAVKKCNTAGIRPVMITGDHKTTAIAIAQEIGIFHSNDDKALTGVQLQQISDEELYRDVKQYAVYARVAPEHKVRIVKAWQSHGEVVAMTGDGVNDAPALKNADIGVAMGIVGTEVAKDAADIILTDDNFATIVSAVQEGRRIYDNILKAIQFLLSANVGEVLLIFIASIFNLGNPLSPIMILWINLVTDSLPALALSMDPAEKDVMSRKPKQPNTGFFTKAMVWRIFYQGAVIGAISLIAYKLGFKDGGTQLGQTMAFAVLAFSQLLHVRNLHSNKMSSFKFSILHNKMLLAAIAISAGLMLIVLLIPAMRSIFGLVNMDIIHWGYVGILSLMPIVVVEIVKLFKVNEF